MCVSQHHFDDTTTHIICVLRSMVFMVWITNQLFVFLTVEVMILINTFCVCVNLLFDNVTTYTLNMLTLILSIFKFVKVKSKPPMHLCAHITLPNHLDTVCFVVHSFYKKITKLCFSDFLPTLPILKMIVYVLYLYKLVFWAFEETKYDRCNEVYF